MAPVVIDLIYDHLLFPCLEITGVYWEIHVWRHLVAILTTRNYL